jgi:hypothetical protein
VSTRVAPSETPHTGDAEPDLAKPEINARVAFWCFVAFIAVSFPLLVFKLGSYHWFFRDDFIFLSGRQLNSVDDLFRPNNSHWSTVPVVAFRALWALFGMRSYRPYQMCVVGLHLSVCVLLRVIMRRAGVNPWIATAAAASFVLFGPGEQNIIWAFQIGFTGSVVFGLVQLLLIDHDGPVDWRDALGVCAGILSLMSSGVGVAMAVVVGLAALLRRGWKVALLQAGPLAVAYVVYALSEHPQVTSVFGRPSLGTTFRWVSSAEVGVFRALGHFELVAVVLAAVVVVGVVLLAIQLSWKEARIRYAAPASMLVGALVFSALTAQGRWWIGIEFARSSRYVHIGAALTLPALAVAADAIVQRWRLLTPALAVLFVVAIPWNASKFEDPSFDAAYMAYRKDIITNVVRAPEASEVPRDVRPVPDVYMGEDVTIGFLLHAEHSGKLDPPASPLGPFLKNELQLRLGVSQTQMKDPPANCRQSSRPLVLHPAKGDVFGINSSVVIAAYDDRQPASRGVLFEVDNGRGLTIELDGLDLYLTPPRHASSFTLCTSTP